MIIVSMTSWKERIGNVVQVLDSLLDNSKIPDAIELNLSEAEFPGRENDLPFSILDWRDDHRTVSEKPVLHINWVGRNTKSFKKLIPTVKKYWNQDVKIITVDDDVIYPANFIEDMDKASELYPDRIISNNFCRGAYGPQQCVNGAGTLYKPSFFTPFLWEDLTDDIIATNADDWWYSFCLWITGVRLIKYIPIKLQFFNEVNPNEHQSMNPVPVLQHKWLEVIHRTEVSGGAGR